MVFYRNGKSVWIQLRLFVSCVVLLAVPAKADTIDWSGGSSGNTWFTALNWENQTAGQPDRVPTSSDDASIFSGGTPLIDSSIEDAETADLFLSSGATLNHTRGLLTVYGSMDVAGTVNFNLGISAGSATLNNLATSASGNAMWVLSGGQFKNFGGDHFGSSGETLRIDGTYALNAAGGTLDFDEIQVRGGNGFLDWNAGTLATDLILLRDSGKWQVTGSMSYNMTLIMQDTSEIEMVGSGGIMTTLTLANGSTYSAKGGTIDGHLILSTEDTSLSGDIDVLGNFSQLSGGKITAKLGPGTSAGEFDVTGTASLAGELKVTADVSYTPADGDTFTLIAASSRSGYFDTFTSFQVSGQATGLLYDSTSVTVKLGLVGDLNDDGFVGIADLNIVLGNWNSNVIAGVWAGGDPSGDGFVGIEDLNAVLGNWNAGTPPSVLVTLPEPASITLLGIPLFAGVSRCCAKIPRLS